MKFSLGTLIALVTVVGLVTVGCVCSGGNPIGGCLGLLAKPKDLGVTWTSADMSSAATKLGIVSSSDTLPSTTNPAQSIRWTGSKPVDATFNSKEITAVMSAQSNWAFNPIKDMQVKVDNTGMAEMSGNLVVDRVTGFATAFGISQDVIKQATDAVKTVGSLGVSLPFYGKYNFKVVDNKFTAANVQEAMLGPVNLTRDQVQQALPQLMRLAEQQTSKIPGYNVKLLEFVPNGLRFVGSLPNVAYSK
jgi:hypothetical protein